MYTLLVDFRKAPEAGATARTAAVVQPDDIEVKITGAVRGQALVMHKLGTIPEAQEVESEHVECGFRQAE